MLSAQIRHSAAAAQKGQAHNEEPARTSTNDQAVDIAFVIGNVETYLQFSDVCGWTLDEWQQRTGELLNAALVGSAGY